MSFSILAAKISLSTNARFLGYSSSVSKKPTSESQWTLHTYVCTVWEEPGRMRRAQRQGVSHEHLHL
jgi:hypothetical protein